MAIEDRHRIGTFHPGSPDERVAGATRSWREDSCAIKTDASVCRRYLTELDDRRRWSSREVPPKPSSDIHRVPLRCEAVKHPIHSLADLSPAEGVGIERVVQDEPITDGEE